MERGRDVGAAAHLAFPAYAHAHVSRARRGLSDSVQFGSVFWFENGTNCSSLAQNHADSPKLIQRRFPLDALSWGTDPKRTLATD